VAEQNGNKKWDAKTVVIAALIATIPVAVGITYNVTSFVAMNQAAEITRLGNKMDSLREEVYGLKMQVTRLEVKVGNP
jgi:hypothetical protein